MRSLSSLLAHRRTTTPPPSPPHRRRSRRRRRTVRPVVLRPGLRRAIKPHDARDERWFETRRDRETQRIEFTTRQCTAAIISPPTHRHRSYVQSSYDQSWDAPSNHMMPERLFETRRDRMTQRIEFITPPTHRRHPPPTHAAPLSKTRIFEPSYRDASWSFI